MPERILLPRLPDVVTSLLQVYRHEEGNLIWPVSTAFMNIPAGSDRKFTVTAVPWALVVFNTLVFGSACRGRFASWLGRSTAAVADTDPQCYVDDPVYVMFGPGLGAAARDLAITLLWVAVAGFPTKLCKVNGGKSIEWVGAGIECDDDEKSVTVTTPEQRRSGNSSPRPASSSAGPSSAQENCALTRAACPLLQASFHTFGPSYPRFGRRFPSVAWLMTAALRGKPETSSTQRGWRLA